MKFSKPKVLIFGIIAIIFIAAVIFVYFQLKANTNNLKSDFTMQINSVSSQLSAKSQELETLKNEDQFKKNQLLEAEIKNIHDTYQQTAIVYEDILNFRADTSKTQKINSQFSLVLSQLSNRNYSSASATLTALKKDIQSLQNELAVKITPIPENVPVNNSPPVNGLSKQVVEVDSQKFAVDIFSASLDSAKVQVETASQSDCGNNCPVSSLADYVAKSSGFAGINGPYFCPAEYPSCAGKANSFDTLLMNKNKYYFNSSNNVYSNVPAMIFSGNNIRLVEKSSDWGRDTSVDAVIASQPLLVSGGEVRFGGDGDGKKTQKGTRSFIASRGNTVYIGVVRNATVAEVAKVLKTLGMQSALNLDSGGSTAFYVNGKYIAGPGRQTPFGIVLVRK